MSTKKVSNSFFCNFIKCAYFIILIYIDSHFWYYSLGRQVRKILIYLLNKVYLCIIIRELEDLNKYGQVVQLTSNSRQEFYNDLKTKYANSVAIYRHNDSASKIGFFDKELIESLPSSVKYICHNGAGYDQIDVDAATKKG